jgi:hypothetical protein
MVFPLELLKPNIELGADAVQLKVVLTTFEVNEMPVVCPEQISCEPGVAVITGIGLTLTR